MSGRRSKSKAAAKVPLSDRPGPLKREDITCSICWSIFIEPVTLPCGHALCCTCFKKHVAETSLQCPCCRMRISVWSRRAFKQNNLVDKKLWERIQREFPKLVQTRLLGEDSQNLLDDDLVSILDKNLPLTTGGGGHIVQSPSPLASYENNNEDDNENDKFPVEAILKRDGEISLGNGELKRELEEMNKKHMEDIENERRMEENESQQLIRQLQTEATNRANEEEEEDRRLAEQLAEQEKKELGAAINAKRKLFTESSPAGSSSFSENLSKTPNSSKKSYNEATTPRRSTGGKRTSFSLSGSAERPNNKKQKSGRLTLSQPPSASGGGQNSQNSILKYISSSSQHQQQQQSNTSPCSQSSSSSVAILNSPKPSTSTAAKLQYKLAQDTPVSSFVSTSSAFSSIKPINKGPVQVVPSKSVIYQQSILKPMNRTEKGEQSSVETGGTPKDCERDIPTPNSIDLEVNYHFRPIRSAPKTPPQKLPDGSFLPEPVMVKTTPVKLVPCVIIDISGDTDDDENSQRMDNDYDLEPERESEFNISCIPLENLQDSSEESQGSSSFELDATNSAFNVEHHDEAQPTSNVDDNAPLDNPQIDETDSAGNSNPPILKCTTDQNSQVMDDDLSWLLDEDLPDSQDSQVSANIDLDMVQKQAEELKRIRERQVQEEMDLRLARKLQKQLNQPPTRRTEEENPFSLRNWLNNKRQSTTANCSIGCSEPSTSSHANHQRGELQPTRRSTRRSNATITQDTLHYPTFVVKDETTE